MRLRMEPGRPKPKIRAEPRNHAVLHGPSCLLPPPCDAPTLPQVARKFLLSNLLLNERPLFNFAFVVAQFIEPPLDPVLSLSGRGLPRPPLDFSFYCRFSPFFATTSAPSRAFCGMESLFSWFSSTLIILDLRLSHLGRAVQGCGTRHKASQKKKTGEPITARPSDHWQSYAAAFPAFR